MHFNLFAFIPTFLYLITLENFTETNKCYEMTSDSNVEENDIVTNDNTQLLPPRKYVIVWTAVPYYIYLHLAALYGLYLGVMRALWPTIVFTFFIHITTGVGLTAGVHRLWAHKSYKAKLPLQILLMLLHSATNTHTVITWCRNHWLHHKYSDTDADPHNSRRGFFFCHIGWLMVRKHPEAVAKGKAIDLTELYANPVLRFQQKDTMDPSAILHAASPRQHAISKATRAGDSEIQEFYRDAVIFITGGSGFIGKQLVEKLFRSCQIKRVYLLMRPRKDKDIRQRLVSMLQDPVFDPVREAQPGFADQIYPVAGDIAQLKLGLSDDDWKTITEEVSIIFHVAATVRFDEPLQSAVLLNVRGTREVLRLARASAKLRSLVHVSTAYAFATADRISDEVGDHLYKPPVPPEMLIQMAESMDTKKIDKITSLLISGWPNTYCFTKATAEDLVRSLGEDLPVSIVRPSIVIDAYTEPLPGWLEESCVFGASGLTLGSTLGVIHTIRANQDIYVDFVPVDYVNNVIIAAGWAAAKGGGSQTKVYAVTSARKGIQWRDVSTCLNKNARNYISPKASWYGFVWETNNYYLHLFYSIILHFIPAYVIDGVTSVFGKQSGLVNLYKKIYKMSIVLRYFTNNDWKFKDNNTVELRKNMSETDRIIFNFDITDINVSEWILLWVLGLRKYVVKDGLKGTKYAVKQQKIYYFINCLAILVICFSIVLFLKVLYFC